jgi:hypothetical protein
VTEETPRLSRAQKGVLTSLSFDQVQWLQGWPLSVAKTLVRLGLVRCMEIDVRPSVPEAGSYIRIRGKDYR